MTKLQQQRADAGHSAIAAASEEDGNDGVVDTLANIMHFCHRQGIAFDDALRTARDHYQAETV